MDEMIQDSISPEKLEQVFIKRARWELFKNTAAYWMLSSVDFPDWVDLESGY